MKVRLGTIIVLLLVILSVVACSDSTGKNKVDSDIEVVSEVEGKVRFSLAGSQLENGIDPITGAETIGFEEFIDTEFSPRYPNIELEIYQVPWENAQAKQSAMLQSG